jgi:hypothetical protein
MATTTFVTTVGEDAALVEAFGDLLGLGRNATQAEIKSATVTFWRKVVTNYQRKKAANDAAITNVSPT